MAWRELRLSPSLRSRGMDPRGGGTKGGERLELVDEIGAEWGVEKEEDGTEV